MWAGSWIFTQKKKLKDQRNYAKCACAAFHHCKGNACVLFQRSSWFYSDWFWLLDYLWQSLYHLDVTNSFIDVSKFSDNTITSTTHCEAMWAPLSIPILSGVIWFLLPFNFSLNFYALSVFDNSTEFNSFVGWRAGQWKNSGWRSNWGKFLH